jgi:hypothetical protein
MSEPGFAAERGAELLPAVGRVRIAMGELLLEPVSNVAHISNRLVRTLAPNKYTASGAAEDRLCAARVIQQQLLPKELPSLDGVSHPTTSRRVRSAAIFTISSSCPTANSRSSPATSLTRVSPPRSL